MSALTRQTPAMTTPSAPTLKAALSALVLMALGEMDLPVKVHTATFHSAAATATNYLYVLERSLQMSTNAKKTATTVTVMPSAQIQRAGSSVLAKTGLRVMA